MSQYSNEPEERELNLEAAHGLLGSMLLDQSQTDAVRAIITPSDFPMPELGIVYSHLLAMDDEGLAFDGTMLLSRLRASGDFVHAGGLETFGRIIDAVPTARNLMAFARDLAAESRKQRLRREIERITLMARDGVPQVELLNAMNYAVETFTKDDSGGVNLEALPLADLVAGDYSQHYLIDEVIPKGECGLFSAAYKVGKTHIAGDALVSLTTGTRMLGKFRADGPMNTGFVSVESSKAAIKEMFVRICRARGIDPATITTLFICTECPQLPRDAALVEKFITDHQLGALVLDPAYLLMAGIAESASNDMAMGQALRVLTDIGKRTGCTIILVTHNKKPKARPTGQRAGFDAPSLDDIAHAGYAAWARWFVLLAPRKEFDSEVGQHWLWMRTGGSAGHSGLWAVDVFEGKQSNDEGRVWDVTVSTATDAAKDRQEESERAETDRRQRIADQHAATLRETLAAHPNGETKSGLRSDSGLNEANFREAFKTLKSRGEVEPCEVTKSGKRYEGFKPTAHLRSVGQVGQVSQNNDWTGLTA